MVEHIQSRERARPSLRGAQTAGRALEVMEIVGRSAEAISLIDVAEAAGINKPAAYRVLRELETRGFVVREPVGGSFRAGGALIALAASVLRRVDIRRTARPVMERLVKEAGETLSLHLRHLRTRICIEALETHQPIRRVVELGETLPLYAGPSGKAIVAFLPPWEIDSIVDWAAAEGQDVAQLRKALGRLQQDGFMASVGDRTPGVGGLSVPLFSDQGVVASMTISGPSTRWTLEAMSDFASLAVQECGQLSRALGFVEQSSASNADDGTSPNLGGLDPRRGNANDGE